MLVKEEVQFEIKELMLATYQLFEKGRFSEARGFLDKAHSLDFEDVEIRTALRTCGFWVQRMEGLESISGHAYRGDYLRRQWLIFEDRYVTSFEHPFEEGRSHIREWVHSEALASYMNQVAETGDTESLFQGGRCLKVLGRFEDAIRRFEDALNSADGGRARFMAELADTYALIGESRPGKVLMREAMFLDASKIDLDALEAPVFRRLIKRLEEDMPLDHSDFPYWLAVYGALWGVLDVKRELSPVEYGKLKQTIYALKSEIADANKEGNLKPRLFNRYLWLIDHYQLTGADRTTIEDVLMNIKLLDLTIYGKYFE